MNTALLRTRAGALCVDMVSLLPRRIRHRILRPHIWILQREADEDEYLYGLQDAYRSQSIFFHVPKTAGMSIAHALWGGPGASHLTPEHAKLVFGFREYRTFFKFCFVRNPYDRLVSAWAFLLEGGLHSWKSRWVKEHISPYSDLRQFVREKLPTDTILSNLHFRPQYRFLTNRSGQVVADFIGRYERIEDDFSHIARKIGTQYSALPKKNRSSRSRDLTQYYDADTANTVWRVYRRDFDLFEYPREVPAPGST